MKGSIIIIIAESKIIIIIPKPKYAEQMLMKAQMPTAPKIPLKCVQILYFDAIYTQKQFLFCPKTLTFAAIK